jgi:AraC-like DNA-binding protein
MAFAPQIRKYILQALDQFIIPALQKETVPQILAAPPFGFSQVEHWTLRSKYLPHKTPELTQMVWAWKSERMVTSRMPYIGFVYEGKADEKIGITSKMAKALSAATAAPRGITAVRLTAPAAICFPPGAPRRDGSGPFCETSRLGFAASRIIWIHVTVNELLVHYCESDPNNIFSSHALHIKDGLLTQLARAYVDELHYMHREGEETARALLLALMKRLRRHLATRAVPLCNTEWPSHNLIIFQEARSRGEYLCQMAVEYIVMHLQDPITWEMLAAHLECSPSYLNRVFQKFTGMPVMRYVTFRRIEAAKLLLSREGQRISEIARLTGFANIDSFSACFKRLVGCNPREFRRQIQTNGMPVQSQTVKVVSSKK